MTARTNCANSVQKVLSSGIHLCKTSFQLGLSLVWTRRYLGMCLLKTRSLSKMAGGKRHCLCSSQLEATALISRQLGIG